MLELLFAALLMVCMFCFFAGGVAAVMSEMRRTDADLYHEWMRRRDARRERR